MVAKQTLDANENICLLSSSKNPYGSKTDVEATYKER